MCLTVRGSALHRSSPTVGFTSDRMAFTEVPRSPLFISASHPGWIGPTETDLVTLLTLMPDNRTSTSQEA